MHKLTAREKGNLLMEGWHTIDELYAKYAKSVGLSYSSLSVLEYIYYTKDCTQKLICEELFLPKQTVNSIVSSFRELGFVLLKESESDRRNKTIALSRTGRMYAEKVMSELQAAEESAMDQVSDEQLQNVLSTIQKYVMCFRESIEKEPSR